MEPLSPRQIEVLDFIRGQVDARGIPPSIREIAAHLGVTGTPGVVKHLEALERKGYLHREEGSSRGIRLVDRDPAEAVIRLPVAGTVQAGLPQHAAEEISDYVVVAAKETRGGTFFLRIRGESMIDAAILPGDLALIRPQETACNGDIVVAMTGDEATVKFFYHEKDHIRLQPANSAMEPIIVPAGEPCIIIGKVVRIVRNLE